MAGPLTIWGIDVGKSALKAVKLRQAADKSFEVVAADYVEHARIMGQKEVDNDAQWSAALEKFLSRNDISNDKVVVSVPGQITFKSFSKLPPIAPKDLKKKLGDIVGYEADQQIPFDMDEVVWDFQTFQVPESPEIEVGIFAIKKDLIRQHLHHFELAGIEPMAVQTAPLALFNAMHADGALGTEATVMIDIGTDNTDLLVATEHSLWTRTINLGGNNFTEALVKSFKLKFSKAESLKRSAGTSKYARQIFQAMRPIFADLVQELQRSIGFYTATHRDAEIARVIGLGSAFKLPGLKKYVQQNLQLDFERLESFQKIQIPTNENVSEEHIGSFAVAYGLAVQGFGAVTQSSLLPPEIVKQVIWRKKRPFFAAAAACLLLAAGVVWFRGMKDMGALQANAGSPNVSVSYEQAEGVMNSPPPVPDREFGKTILAMARAFQQKNNTLTMLGTEETRKVETLQEYLLNRAVWLRILEAVHAALPVPFEMGSENAYVESVKASGLTRPLREQVFVDSLTSEYSKAIDGVTIDDQWSANTNVIENKGGERTGFLITLACRTPHRDKGVMVVDQFVDPLRQLGRRPGQGFYFNRIGVKTGSSTEGPSRGSGRGGGRGAGVRPRPGAGRDPGRRRPGTRPPRPGREPAASVGPRGERMVDDLLNEPMGDDWRFEVQIEVVLEDFPEPEKEAGA